MFSFAVFLCFYVLVFLFSFMCHGVSVLGANQLMCHGTPVFVSVALCLN